MKWLFMLFVLIIGCAPTATTKKEGVTGGVTKVTGIVVEKGTKRGLSDVWVETSPNTIKVLTNIEGSFSFGIEPGSYTIIAHKDAYFDKRVTVNVKPGEIKHIGKISLEPILLPIPELP